MLLEPGYFHVYGLPLCVLCCWGMFRLGLYLRWPGRSFFMALLWFDLLFVFARRFIPDAVEPTVIYVYHVVLMGLACGAVCAAIVNKKVKW